MQSASLKQCAYFGLDYIHAFGSLVARPSTTMPGRHVRICTSRGFPNIATVEHTNIYKHEYNFPFEMFHSRTQAFQCFPTT